MPALSVCPYCRKTCAICHTEAQKPHGLIVCLDCSKQYQGKCYVCGGPKKGPGTVGAVGTGSVCSKCFKSTTKCAICGNRL